MHAGEVKHALGDDFTVFDLGEGDPMAVMQQLLGDPAVMLGAVQSAEQASLAPALDAAVAAVIGAVDYLVDSVAVRVIGGEALRIAEAVRRRRLWERRGHAIRVHERAMSAPVRGFRRTLDEAGAAVVNGDDATNFIPVDHGPAAPFGWVHLVVSGP